MINLSMSHWIIILPSQLSRLRPKSVTIFLTFLFFLTSLKAKLGYIGFKDSNRFLGEL